MELALREDLTAASPTLPLRRRHFAPVVVGGWGDAQNTYVHAMAWFQDHLYAGVTRNALNGVRPYPRSEAMAIYPVKVPDIQWDLDWRAPIWRYAPAAGTWERVFVSPMAMGSRGFPVPRQWGYRNMAVFQGRSDPAPALYAVSWGSHMGPGPHVLRSLDGCQFDEVGDEALKRIGATTLRGLVSFKGRLFTSPAARCGGTDTGTHDVPIILVSEDPACGAWHQACPPCFGDPNNIAVSVMAANGHYLYAGTMNPVAGYQIWRTAAEGPPPYRWEPVIIRGAFRGNLNEAAATLCPFRGSLYVGSGIYNLGFDRIHGVGPGMPELIRIHPDGSWELVAGEPRNTPQGVKTPLSGMGAGFNNPFVGYIWSMCEHQGCLYLGTANWSSWLLFTRDEIWDEHIARHLPSVDRDALLAHFGGFELWRSPDGARWEAVTRNGFGNPYNVGVRTMVSSPAGLFIGVVNQFGEEVAVRRTAGWRYESNRQGGVEVWLGRHDRRPARPEVVVPGRQALPWPEAQLDDYWLLLPGVSERHLGLVTRFYEGSGWHATGFWRPGGRSAREACENLLEELLAFFRQEPEGREPRYPKPEEVAAWMAARSARPWEDYQAERTALSCERVLDVGCGLGSSTGYLSRYFAADGLVGVAAGKKAAAVCRRRFPGLRFVAGRWPRLPFGRDAFDKAVCLEGLAAGGSRRRLLAEIWRVLAPGGLLALADLLRPASGNEPRSAEELAALLEEMGFQEVRVADVTSRTSERLRVQALRFFHLEAVLKGATGDEVADFLAGLPGGSGETRRFLIGCGRKGEAAPGGRPGPGSVIRGLFGRG
ncbi:MAG: class I SAM-dependent methyltransferase [Thermodesulfobacteriota bacterium]